MENEKKKKGFVLTKKTLIWSIVGIILAMSFLGYMNYTNYNNKLEALQTDYKISEFHNTHSLEEAREYYLKEKYRKGDKQPIWHNGVLIFAFFGGMGILLHGIGLVNINKYSREEDDEY